MPPLRGGSYSSCGAEGHHLHATPSSGFPGGGVGARVSRSSPGPPSPGVDPPPFPKRSRDPGSTPGLVLQCLSSGGLPLSPLGSRFGHAPGGLGLLSRDAAAGSGCSPKQHPLLSLAGGGEAGLPGPRPLSRSSSPHLFGEMNGGGYGASAFSEVVRSAEASGPHLSTEREPRGVGFRRASPSPRPPSAA